MISPSMYVRREDGSLRQISGSGVFLSAAGDKYVVMLIRGDVKRNGNWVEFIVGDPRSLNGAVNVRRMGRLFTTGLGADDGKGSDQLTNPGLNAPIWVDNTRVGFLWDDRNSTRQVFVLNTSTGKVRSVTRHPTSVLSFSFAPTGALLFNAKPAAVADNSDVLIREGFTIENHEALSLLAGKVGRTSFFDRTDEYERFVLQPGQFVPRKVDSSSGNKRSISYTLAPQWSPDGKLAVVEGTPTNLPTEWSQYTQAIFKKDLASARNGVVNGVLQYFVVDVDHATSWPLWDVPMALVSTGLTVAWAPDQKSVIISPSFLPVGDPDPKGLDGTAIVEIGVGKKFYCTIPVGDETVVSVRWTGLRDVEVETKSGFVLVFKKMSDSWQLIRKTAVLPAGPTSQAITVTIRQDRNTPPSLVAIENASGTDHLISDLNAGLRTDVSLGRVEEFKWKTPDGREWRGSLYYPVGYTTSARYPLVIQSDGGSELDFSLSGQGGWHPGVGPGWSVFLAQPLANNGIAVLQAEGNTAGAPPGDDQKMWLAAYEAAVESLTSIGLVDRSRVGLMGFSHSGRYVEYAISHSEFPFAAAIASDNSDGSYIQAAMMSWDHDRTTTMNGAEPFGDGLQAWLKNCPSFNAHRVMTPLQIQAGTATGGFGTFLWNGWEMFTRLRFLGKAVELYAIPDMVVHGTHTTQNPGQCLAAQTRALDWWLFWLKDFEDCAPAKAKQYENWRQLRATLRSQPNE